MIRVYSIAPTGVLAACLLLFAGHLASADDAATKPEAKPAEAAASPAAKPQRTLSPALTALRESVRQTLAMHRKQAYGTRENSATEIMNYSLAFGCTTEVVLDGTNGQRINGITALCWNYPCAGFEMLGLSQDHIAARVGYGCQERPGEFLAMLAMARVQPNYPVRVAKDSRTVADVIEAEKLSCRTGSDMSLKLIGLSYYVDEPEWKNDLGETWSIERIIREEVAQPVVTAPEGGLNRLMGLSYAVARRAKRGQPIEGQFDRAQKYTTDFHEFALQLQNSDGSWGPYFLAAKSTSPDIASQLRSTGRVLEWLATSLPDQKLEDVRVMGAVQCVASLLASQRYQWNTPALSTREIVSAGHALHGLNVFDERVFRPADVVEKPAAEKSSPAAASRDAKTSTSR
jgi:hypothetical protein